jgi:hypothetical protein
MGYTNQKKTIQVLISKKGTKVVIASHLHRALRIPMFKFNRNITKWIEGVYAFEDDMRSPVEFKDYGERKFEFGKQRDYYLSLELARLICLQAEADSKSKLDLAKHLATLEDGVGMMPLFFQRRNKAKKRIRKKININSHKSNGVQLGLF